MGGAKIQREMNPGHIPFLIQTEIFEKKTKFELPIHFVPEHKISISANCSPSQNQSFSHQLFLFFSCILFFSTRYHQYQHLFHVSETSRCEKKKEKEDVGEEDGEGKWLKSE